MDTGGRGPIESCEAYAERLEKELSLLDNSVRRRGTFRDHGPRRHLDLAGSSSAAACDSSDDDVACRPLTLGRARSRVLRAIFTALSGGLELR